MSALLGRLAGNFIGHLLYLLLDAAHLTHVNLAFPGCSCCDASELFEESKSCDNCFGLGIAAVGRRKIYKPCFVIYLV